MPRNAVKRSRTSFRARLHRLDGFRRSIAAHGGRTFSKVKIYSILNYSTHQLVDARFHGHFAPPRRSTVTFPTTHARRTAYSAPDARARTRIQNQDHHLQKLKFLGVARMKHSRVERLSIESPTRTKYQSPIVRSFPIVRSSLSLPDCPILSKRPIDVPTSTSVVLNSKLESRTDTTRLNPLPYILNPL